MKKISKALAIAGLAVLGLVANGNAQVQQSISFSFNIYYQTNNSIRTLHIGNKEIIENLIGTNVPGGKLFLIMQNNPQPQGSSANIGAALMVTDSKGNALTQADSGDITTTVNQFNIYQTSYSQTDTKTVAWNQFSLAFGGLGAELFGTATWSKGRNGVGGQGSFHCSVSGHAAIADIDGPASGSISGGSPR